MRDNNFSDRRINVAIFGIMPYISKDIIDTLNSISCEEVAERLDMSVSRHTTLCPIHDDHHPSLHFFGKNKESWYCFVCNKGGRAISLVEESTDCTFVEACQWLGREFGIDLGLQQCTSKPLKKITHKRRNYPLDEDRPFSTEIAQWILDNSVLTDLGKNFLYETRKLKPDIVQQFNIVSIDKPKKLVYEIKKVFSAADLEESGLFTKDKLYFRLITPCLFFPYYDIDGELVGIQSRYLGDNKEFPRFQFVASQRTRLFNLELLNSLEEDDDLYISEGITDCLALLSSGKNAVAVPSATILPKDDLFELRNYRLHMYPDQDDAGQMAYDNLRRFFVRHYATLLREELPYGAKDFSDYYLMGYVKDE